MSDLINLSLIHPEDLSVLEPHQENLQEKPEVSSDAYFEQIIDLNDTLSNVSSIELELSDDTHSNDLFINFEEQDNIEKKYTQADMLSELREILKENPNQINRGDGKMDYIDDIRSREMLENAWQAINLTETWDFVSQPIQSFMFSNDERIWVITKKMSELGYDNHSGFTFGWTMRNMQYLANNGVDKFREAFIEPIL
jgi:hypothetical protein